MQRSGQLFTQASPARHCGHLVLLVHHGRLPGVEQGGDKCLSVTRGPFGPLVDIRFFAVTHTFVGGGHLPQSELRNQFDQRDVTVVRADGPDLRLPRRPFKVVSNPPFGITTWLVKRLVSPGSRLVRADLACRGMPRSAGARKTLPAEDAGTVTSWSISVGRHLGRRFVHHRRTTSLCS